MSWGAMATYVDVDSICRVKRSAYGFYDVKVGDLCRVVEIRYRGSSVEAACVIMDRTGEEHWFRTYDLELA